MTCSESNAPLPSSASIRDLIGTMAAIGPDELARVALPNRVEKKFVLGEGQMLKLLSLFRHEYRILQVKDVRSFDYATLYFDTHRRNSFRHHHNGKLNRCKFRIRKYGESGECFLEVKMRGKRGRNEIRRMPAPGIEEQNSEELSAFIRTVTGVRHDIEPVLWTYFSRITLLNSRYAEQVTFDRQIRFRCQECGSRLSGVVIAEIKQDRDDRTTPMREWLRSRSVRPVRVSKYCLGSMLLWPGIKYNRFKSMLVAIEQVAERYGSPSGVSDD